MQEVRQGLCKPNLIFVGKIANFEETQDQKSKSCGSGDANIELPDTQNLRANDTDLSDTEYSDTDSIKTYEKKINEKRVYSGCDLQSKSPYGETPSEVCTDSSYLPPPEIAEEAQRQMDIILAGIRANKYRSQASTTDEDTDDVMKRPYEEESQKTADGPNQTPLTWEENGFRFIISPEGERELDCGAYLIDPITNKTYYKRDAPDMDGQKRTVKVRVQTRPTKTDYCRALFMEAAEEGYENDQWHRDDEREEYDAAQRAIIYYLYELYTQYMGRAHPKLKDELIDGAYGRIKAFMVENELNEGMMKAMMEQFFHCCIESNYNILHFATQGVMQNRLYEVRG